jgi:Ca-activated chloride channel family protein
MAYARQVIEDGGIPEPSAITVEGMLSEHSIDLAPPRDAGALYSTATVAWNTDFDELTPLITVQVGFGTNIDPATFKRTPLNLCLVIDRSGSMNEAFDERTRTSKLEAVRIAVDRLLARLKPSDRISVVAFATDPGVLLDPVPGNDIAAVKSALDEIEVQGNTDLARGMLRGYRLVQSNHDASRSDRLMVFTDARITAGVRQSGDLIAVMEDFVAEGIGATIVGVGTDFGQELAADISQVRGGNVVYLSDHDRIVQVFDEEFDFLVSPVAYDVRLAATIPFALDVADAFGFPDAQAGGHTLELLIPSRFYSARQGGAAIFIRLRPGALVDFDETVEVATLTLDYRTSTGDSQSDSMQITLPVGQDPDAAEPYFETEATQRAVLLLNTALALKNASRDAFEGYDRDEATGRTIYQFPELDDVNRALARLTEFLPYFDDLAAGLPDQSAPTSRSLSQERAVVESLLNNIRDQHAFRETR